VTHQKPTYDELLQENNELKKMILLNNTTDTKIMKELAENSNDVFWIRTDDEMIYISPSFEQIWGIPCEEIYKDPQIFTKTIHPGDKEKILKTLQSDQFQKTGHFDKDYRIVRPNGEIRWINAKALPIINQEGKIIRRIGFARDITDQREIIEKTGLLAEMLDIAPNSITIHDEKGNFFFANQKTFELHGYTKEEFMGINLFKLDVPVSAELIKERIEEARKNGSVSFEAEHYHKNGKKIPLEIFAKPVKWKEIPAILSIATDITERKKIIKELLEAKEKAVASENKIRSMFENSLTGFIYFDLEGNLIEANPAVLKMFGSPSLKASQEKINLLKFESLKKIGFDKDIYQCSQEEAVISNRKIYTS